jgi:hypothetical protein
MISLILIFFSGVCNSVMDVLRYRYNVSIFRFWPNQNWVNPALSWPNKWKPKTKLGDLIMSTVLVWATDFWHFAKMIMLVTIMLSIILYKPLINWWSDFLLLFCAFTVTFEIFFRYIFIKK